MFLCRLAAKLLPVDLPDVFLVPHHGLFVEILCPEIHSLCPNQCRRKLEEKKEGNELFKV